MKFLKLVALSSGLLATAGCSNNSAISPTSAEEVSLNSVVLGTDAHLAPQFGAGGRAIFDVLNLSKEQMMAIEQIWSTHRERMRDQRAASGGRISFEERKARSQEMRAQLQEQINQVLTIEQRAKAEALKTQLEQGKMPEEIIDARIERLHAQLNLSAEQKMQIKELELARPVMGRQGWKQREASRQETRDVRRAHREKFLRILSPEQQAILTQQMSKQREQMQQRFQGMRQHRSGARLDHLATELDLSEDQKQQLQELFRSVPEEFQSAQSKADRMQAMYDRMTKMDEQIQSILTAEQLQKYNEMKAARQLRGHPKLGENRG